MRYGVLMAVLGMFCLQKAWGVNFAMDTWILILEPENGKPSQVLTLKYIGDESGNSPGSASRTLKPVPVELSIYPRYIDLDGKVTHDTLKPSSDFVIYPSQIILYPGDVQKVQVQWVSDKPLTKELAYGLIAVQLPVNLESNSDAQKSVKAQLTILTRYEGIVVVRPRSVKPQIVVDTVYSGRDSAGKTLMMVQLQNKGTGLQTTKDMHFSIAPLDDKGRILLQKRIDYSPVLNVDQSRHAVFAGQKRRFTVPWPANIPVGPVQVIPVFP